MATIRYQLDHDTWTRLARHEGEPCVTAILPLKRSDFQGEGIRIRLKNARSAAEKALEDRGVEAKERERILEPLQTGPADSPEVPRGGATLIAALSPSLQQVTLLSASVEERLDVSDRFVLSELLAVLDEPRSWYVLELSDGGARLVHVEDGSPYEMELPLEREDRMSANAERVDPTMGGAVPFRSERDDLIERQTWYRFVDQGLKSLDLGKDPLVLVADVVHHRGFLKICKLPGLQRQAIDHGETGLKPAELRELALSVVEPLVEPDLEAIGARWAKASEEGRTSTDPDFLREAAVNGQVQSIYWVPDAARDEDDPAVTVEVDDAVRQTVLHGGEAVALEVEDLPHPGTESARIRVNGILRWVGEA